MVVLSVAILSSTKTLVARQFVEMTRIRVEGLLSAFPKLVDTGKDHTFIETETVRYVYQPMESLYLVLVTNKSSNILEDLETLRLLAKVVQDSCQIQVKEEEVLAHAFDIIFAFDEVISFGHRESVTLSQIKTYTEMDSHEEKLHQMIEQSKINEAREMAKKKQQEFQKQRKEGGMQMEGFGGGGPSSSPSMGGGGGMGGGMGGMGGGGMGGMGGMGGGGMGGGLPSMSPDHSALLDSSTPWSSAANSDSGPTLKPNAPKKGMALGKKKPADILGSLGVPEPAADPVGQAAPAEAAPAAPAYNPLMDPVSVQIEETITADLQVEGGLNGEITCQGSFSVTVHDTAKADLVCFQLNPQDQTFKYKVHPNLNKASQANNILEVRDAQRAYRGNTPLPLLKWHMKSGDEAFLPVTLSCWPTPTAEGTQVVLELELTRTDEVLEDVRISFPGAAAARAVTNISAEPGEGVNQAGMGVQWLIPRLDGNESTGTLEFTAACDAAQLFPFQFDAVRRGETKCLMNILSCYHQERKDQIAFACEKTSTYSFKIDN
eukprot:TRINITY_DN6300_c0_g3_i1.p1 TRINITY_DN6300_c0_g3~~TRINITY_DN6300_c0_g3_i1.p1  ORF type:complete len:547 (+),score=143.28 TRINITY_DN6300_c0_g3_i1:108-1748(+)